MRGRQPYQLLIVDDDADIRYIIKASLSPVNGFRVEEAADGVTGLRLAREQNFDVIVLDFWLPGVSGREVLRDLREMPMYRDTPVLILSGDTRSKIEELCKAHGPIEILSKPFLPSAFIDKVRRMCPE